MTPTRLQQKGAILVTVALVLLILAGFMGIAVDVSRAFVVKGELQSAMDSCALAAAQELDGAADALTRAGSAGQTAGNANGVVMQSATWAGQARITAADITYLDADYNETTVPADARYARCAHAQAGLGAWLLGAMSLFTNDASFANGFTVGARAVATRGSAQSACPVPLALMPPATPQTCKVAGEAADKFGFCVGNWITLLYEPGKSSSGLPSGQIGWANLDGSNSASETEKEMNGSCGTKVGDTLGTPGVQASIADVWNYRFGIYKKIDSIAELTHRPDYTGYAYTAKNWPSESNAYPSFQAKRLAFASCADTGTSLSVCENTIDRKLNSFKDLAPPGQVPGGHYQYGMNRRIVLVPIVNASMKVEDYGCLLMLQPISIPAKAEVQLEYRGLASRPDSPCTTSGLPGGTAGPLVPVLVE